MEKDTLVATDTAGHDTNSADNQAATVVEELLVEEISIDGMCGVY
jgi:mycofactocin precursor